MTPNEPQPTAAEVAEYQLKLSEYQSLLKGGGLDNFLDWIAALIFAAIILAGWFFLGSMLLGLLVAVPITALMILGLFAIKRRRLRPSHEWLKENAHRFQKEKD